MKNWRDLGFDVPEKRAEVKPGTERFARLPDEQQAILSPAKLAA